MSDNKKLYWANVCILIRKEREEIEAAAAKWSAEKGTSYEMVFLGDTEDIRIHERLRAELDNGLLGFDALVSTRFDVFCSRGYLLGARDGLFPIGHSFPIRPEVRRVGVEDPWGLYFPLAILPHFIVRNAEVFPGTPSPRSLSDLLDPFWAGHVVVGNTEMPSGMAVLFSMWYLFGDAGLETCAKNWRQKSAPSGARHGLLKGEYAVAILPGVFSGPGPSGGIDAIKPSEGSPVLPSYAAVKAGPGQDDAAAFLGAALVDGPMGRSYRELAFAVVSNPTVPLPDVVEPEDKFLFPDWDWIQKQDMEYFKATIKRLPMI